MILSYSPERENKTAKILAGKLQNVPLRESKIKFKKILTRLQFIQQTSDLL